MGELSPNVVPFQIIARIHTDFGTKFGVPRQSGLANSLKATIVMEPEYRVAEAFRGLEEFSHIWLIWQFSRAVREGWSPTVRPPRLGGNVRKGVFATRSPFRPNEIGLSSVRLEHIEHHPTLGPVLHIAGADLMNGTPILDIKPYLPYVDCHTDAAGGFTATTEFPKLTVVLPPELRDKLPASLRAGLCEALALDPRPAFQHEPVRVYGFSFGGYEVGFTVDGRTLTVCRVERTSC